MRKLIDFFGTQGLFADLSTVFVFVVGLISVLTIERKVFPNVQFEMISVTSIFAGASSEEVERLVTNPLEQELREVDGIKKMMSFSMDGRGMILLQLDPDQTTVEKGKSDIQSVVDRVTDLPEDVEDPLVKSLEMSLEPVIQVSISSDLPEEDLRKVAKRLEREVESISGVARVQVDGLRDIEYRVEVNLAKLRNYQLSLDDIIRALDLQNLNVPGGLIEGYRSSTKDVIVRTIGELRSIDDVRNTVVRANLLGKGIKVKDVATVTQSFEKALSFQHTNGRASMNLTVLKQVSADAINVVDNIKKRMKEIEGSVPEGIYVSYINDGSYYIRRRLSVLSGNLFWGLVFVLLILTLVMPFRISLITSIGIPFAFLGAIYLMDQFDISFNIITMMGLIIVVGMLVDDAIVVTENIVRHMENGLAPMKAAVQGAQEIWAPVTASVLTTVMAFIPMLTMDGMMGKFFRYIPIAVILALVISLYECFFILPHHLGRWAGTRIQSKRRSFLSPVRDIWDKGIARAYIAILERIIKKPIFRYGVAVFTFAIFIFTMMAATKLVPFIMFPKNGIEQLVINMETEVGTPLEKMRELVKPVEAEVARIPGSELNDFTTKLGRQSLGDGDPNSKRGSHFAQIQVFLKPENDREKSLKDLVEGLRSSIGKPEGLTSVAIDAINPGGPGGGSAIEVGVNGQDYDEVLEVVAQVKEIAKSVKGSSDIVDSYLPGKKEIQVKVDKTEAAAAGLTVGSIGTTVRAAYEGIVATTIRRLDEEVNVRVSLPIEERSTEESLQKLKIPNSSGGLVPLSRVAQLERSASVAQYDHLDNKRQVKVLGNVDEKVTTSTLATEEIQKKLEPLKKKYPGITFSYGGEFEDTEESKSSLQTAGISAVLGIALILILLFKNIFQPILIVLTIPIGVMAVYWAFMLHGAPMSALGGIGMVALAGVIVNNAIVYIDFVNKERAIGKDIRESIILAGGKRIRPIFLTTLTTVCGILPTVYGLGGLDQFVVPVAMALGWGLFFGSLVSVFVFPSMIAIQDDLLIGFRALFGKLSALRSKE